jgi:hypothetical protein
MSQGNAMIIPSNSEKFDRSWLELIAHDPVHPTIDKETRTVGTRTVLMYEEEDKNQCMICTRVGDDLVQSMKGIFVDSKDEGLTAMFYTIFRLPDALLGVGARALKEAVGHFSAQGVQNFYTLSPVPSLRKHFDTQPTEEQVREFIASRKDPVAKFHLGNGASLHAVNFDADTSDIRQTESWGIMVNYRYTA